MSEDLRESIRTVAVEASSSPATISVEGDYEKEVRTTGEGAATGAGAGLALTGQMIGEDSRAIILAPIILPAAVIIGSVGGATAAKVQQEIQEFRDELTDDLTEKSTNPVGASMLAASLNSRLEKLNDFEPLASTTQPESAAAADAVLEVGVIDLTIMVNGNDANMSTTAYAKLRRSSDGVIMYYDTYRYSQKDTLSNWVKDENALWVDYVDHARLHISREISNDFFEEIVLRHVLRPAGNDSSTARSRGDFWHKTSKTPTPTLSWELFLLGSDAYGEWTDRIDAGAVTYELEIYDEHELVYAADDIDTPHHEVQEALDVCETYSWSVRPLYHIDGKTRAGEWMNFLKGFGRVFRSKGGSPHSATPDFTQDFPQLTIRC